MKYKVTHTTKYSYSEPVGVCHNRIVLSPQSGPRLHVRSHRIVVRPTPQIISRRPDFFGNNVQTFSVEENHRQITITATSRVEVEAAPSLDPSSTPTWNQVVESLAVRSDPAWLKTCVYQFNSPRITRSDAFADYANQSFTPERPILEASIDLTSRIKNDFKYDTKATTVSTATEEAFSIKKGVCQDFAHVEIACLRSIGVPARYVSGYLRTLPPEGKPRLVGADESHAWVAVYCGSDIGWIDMDPTNNCLCSTDHVPVAIGRDYADVTPIKGVFLGGGTHSLLVSVDVAPEE